MLRPTMHLIGSRALPSLKPGLALAGISLLGSEMQIWRIICRKPPLLSKSEPKKRANRRGF